MPNQSTGDRIISFTFEYTQCLPIHQQSDTCTRAFSPCVLDWGILSRFVMMWGNENCCLGVQPCYLLKLSVPFGKLYLTSIWVTVCCVAAVFFNTAMSMR
jgi:hypothetical protein